MGLAGIGMILRVAKGEMMVARAEQKNFSWEKLISPHPYSKGYMVYRAIGA